MIATQNQELSHDKRPPIEDVRRWLTPPTREPNPSLVRLIVETLRGLIK